MLDKEKPKDIKGKRKKSLVGWLGKNWKSNVNFWELEDSRINRGSDLYFSRYKYDITDKKVRITIEEL